MRNRLCLDHFLMGGRVLSHSRIVIDHHTPLPQQAQKHFEQLPYNPNQVTVKRFEEGLRRALLWKDLETNFNSGDEAKISRYALAAILSGEIDPPQDSSALHLWHREMVTEFEEARNWLSRFIFAMERLRQGDDFDIETEPHSFYLRGPIQSLSLGITNYKSLLRAAIPQLDIASGELRFIQPVPDNLVGIQLRLLGQQGEILRRYAYDHSCPQRFAVYSYAEEEKRQFDIWNRQLEEPHKSQQEAGIARLKLLFLKLISRTAYGPEDLPRSFFLPGPARAITFSVSEQVKFGFGRLNLSPGGKAYSVKTSIDLLPCTTTKTIKISFVPEFDGGKTRTYYFVPTSNDFAQIFCRKIDIKGRTVLPYELISPVWDDGEDSRIVL